MADNVNDVIAYQDPKKVISPKAHWQLARVLYDDGPGETSAALGIWNGEFTLGMRWNVMKATPA